MAKITRKFTRNTKYTFDSEMLFCYVKIHNLNYKLKKNTKELKMPIKETFVRINSKRVLHYLQNEYHNPGIYVSYRINEILEHSKLNEWNYISSESNIADKISRYQTFKQLSLEKSWFNSLKFLSNNDFNIEIESKMF